MQEHETIKLERAEVSEKALKFYNAALEIEKTDPIEAVNCFTQAALIGHTRAIDHIISLATTEKLAAAQYHLGCMFYEGKGVDQDYAEGMKWFLLAACQKHPEAQCRLGYVNLDGKCVKVNHTEAIKWFFLSAEQNYAKAQCCCGYMYFMGLGVEKNHIEAEKWYRRAAEQNFPDAQYSLGELYQEGLGVEKNHIEAEKWYRRAAEQNFPGAQFALGIHYEQIKNWAEAVRWYRRGTENNHSAAKLSLHTMYSWEKVPFDTNNAAEYRNDFQKLKIALAINYLTKLANAKNFSGLYHLAMCEGSERLKELCNSSPDDFFAELNKDTLVSREVYQQCMVHLFDQDLAPTFYSGNILFETAVKLTFALRKIQKDNPRYEGSQAILSILAKQTDPYHPYLTQYHFDQHTAAITDISTGELGTYAKHNPRNTLDLDAIEYCESEINKSEEDFKLWLETKFRELEARENNLSYNKARLLHELCFRLAQLNYDGFLTTLKKEPAILASGIEHPLWKPASISIPPHIIAHLKKIPEQHPRFESAKKILLNCERLAREASSEPAKSENVLQL